MQYLSRRALNIAPYTAGEQPKERTYIKLNTNENPYPPSPRVEEVLRAFDAGTLRLYPRPDADGLREAIARAEGVKPQNVFCGNGSDEVLALSFPAFFDEGGLPACFANLTYSFYEVFASFFGVNTHIVPLLEDFSFDLSAMLAADCKGYYLCNPNAPTGIALPLQTVEAFVSAAKEKGRIVIADEAYMDFFGESAVPLTKQYDNLLIVKTFSKSYSLAGIRCGYAVGDTGLISALFRMKDCFNSYPVDAVCQAVCAAAVEDREYREKTCALVKTERERVRSELLSLGFTVPESGANFLFAGRAKLSGEELYTALKREGVLVRFWNKPILKDFLRITVGTPAENDALLEKLKEILR